MTACKKTSRTRRPLARRSAEPLTHSDIAASLDALWREAAARWPDDDASRLAVSIVGHLAMTFRMWPLSGAVDHVRYIENMVRAADAFALESAPGWWRSATERANAAARAASKEAAQ
jgi:hypothetical protein